uniref:Uncharacterized protein n=1 Tax=Panagrolaimus sp. ES5 TaxID=591445 RepID=A0AC34FKG7_9BILA
MMSKLTVLVSIILILFCATSFVNGQNYQFEFNDIEMALEILTQRITQMFESVATYLDRWLLKVDYYFIGLGGVLVTTCIIFLIGTILLCICAPCVYTCTSCIEMCTHCCAGKKEKRAMKRSEKFKYFDERIAALELMNGIKTEIEIIDKDAPQKADENKNKAKKRKGKKGGDEKSVGVSVDGQETKSVQ